ncbi:hypothetical protein [Leptothoe sp. PORK10 BA2]|uniref:hypothetical protein n=1 Tax=Leptothoe sp. PORK10 BA2 TaxID=3110254 RepID=UPI002B2066E2|nr:hypothetical protein [Leptothoe sp. PORK10 BA2]MEA5463459.1 hypothetical protein [Leptothoe sp. PORK10 BA2]
MTLSSQKKETSNISHPGGSFLTKQLPGIADKLAPASKGVDGFTIHLFLHESAARIMIEVADTSIKQDLSLKASLYAAADIKDY